MSNIKKVLDKVKKGKISVKKALTYFNKPSYEQGTNSILGDIQYSDSPEEILIQREKEQEQLDLIDKIMSELDPSERKIIMLHCGEGKTFRSISETTNLPKSTIYDIYKNAIEKINNIPFDKEDIFYIKTNLNGHLKLTSLGYPSDLLSAVNDGGEFKRIMYNGIRKTEYTSKSKCVLGKYLRESFKDNKTYCNVFCGRKNCIENDSNPEDSST